MPILSSAQTSLFIVAGIFFSSLVLAGEKIDINTAPLEDLIKIIHIGKGRARELISLRPFSSLDDLTRIKGIGEKRLEDIKKQGLAYVSPLNQEGSNLEPPAEQQLGEQPELELKDSKGLKTITYPLGIVINEILANTPLGTRDEEGEYIEIFNQNNFGVDLSDWRIKDIAGRTTSYIFPKGTKILAQGFLVFYRPTTKIILNNEGDGLNLIQPEGKINDSVNYQKAARGQSYNRTPSGWIWSSTLTPGSENIVPGQKTEETKGKDEGFQIIDINNAPAEELQKLTGIGQVLAKKIIEARPFYSLDELSKVSGIGPQILEEIKKQGLAWVDPKLEPSEKEKVRAPEKVLAAVSEPVKDWKNPQSFPVFLFAFVLATFSAIIILILKKKLKEKTFYNH